MFAIILKFKQQTMMCIATGMFNTNVVGEDRVDILSSEYIELEKIYPKVL